MLNKLILEKLKAYFIRNMGKPRQLWRVRFKSDVTGNTLEHFAETYEQANRFRSAFGLGGDPSTAPQKVTN
jgi:hypothetical protein